MFPFCCNSQQKGIDSILFNNVYSNDIHFLVAVLLQFVAVFQLQQFSFQADN